MTTPSIIAEAGPLLARYEVIFCDVWGVLHNGHHAFADAGEALARFRRAGGTVILVSNAPVPTSGVERVLDRTGVRRDAWDAIICSGDIALRHIIEKNYHRLYRIGPAARDSALFARLPAPAAALEEAEAIVCTGLRNDRSETVDDYRDLIIQGVARRLPFVCANPDLVVDVGTTRYLCAGSIAAAYELAGGDVFWAGKPYPAAYENALERAAELRASRPDRSRIVAIGDALRTDLAGARQFGIDGVLIASGIHHDEILREGEIDSARLDALFARPGTPPAIAVMAHLRW
jgi:HAD superfamily hydrolase (TIGR01459 family)